ncbi:MAG: PEP-CTERM sorting domain-containing protein [Leptospirillum sp.]
MLKIQKNFWQKRGIPYQKSIDIETKFIFGGTTMRPLVWLFMIGMILSLPKVANATMLDFTSFDFAATDTNSIASNGGTGNPLNTPNTQSTVLFSPTPITYPQTLNYPLNATYTNPTNANESITSDLSTTGNISAQGAITLGHNVSVASTFPSSQDIGAALSSFINFSGNFTGNGSTITIPITVTANFSQSGTVSNGQADVSIDIGAGGVPFSVNYQDSNLSTGSFTKDFTFTPTAGTVYNLFAYSDLSGNVVGNASADLTFLIGAPISSTPISGTPEPSTWLLFGTGVVLMGFMAARKQKGLLNKA